MVEKKGWGRPKGVKQSAETKAKISASVKRRYQEHLALVADHKRIEELKARGELV